MSDHTAEGPRAILVPGDKGYFHAEELSDLGVVVFTQRLPYVDVEGHGRMPAMHPTVNVLGGAGKTVLYYRLIRGDDSDAALDTRLQEVIDRLRVGTIRHDGTHLDIEDVAVEVYRYMEERLASYEQHNDITDDSLDDPESWPYKGSGNDSFVEQPYDIMLGFWRCVSGSVVLADQLLPGSARALGR